MNKKRFIAVISLWSKIAANLAPTIFPHKEGGMGILVKS